MEKLPEQLDESKTAEVFSTSIVNDDLDESHKSLVDYLFAKIENETPDEELADEEPDVEEPDDEELSDAEEQDGGEIVVKMD